MPPRDLQDGVPLWHKLLMRETKALAEVLHDDLAQVLLALRLDISLFALQQKSDPLLAERAAAMLAKADLATRTLSGLINTLQPPDFTLGLAAALESLCRGFQQRFNRPCELAAANDCSQLQPLQTELIYRLAYEALQLAARNDPTASGVVGIKVEACATGGPRLEIRGAGLGFSADGLTADENLGLQLMREYAAVLGGRIESGGSGMLALTFNM
ncbi:MAG: hypothetical protein ABSB19_00090 [Methylomonas sp.]|jgi:signal transduction histidine kinase